MQGRDDHAVVVEAGFLFPFGHPATLTTITQRVFVGQSAGASADLQAVLQQVSFVTAREPVVDVAAPTTGGWQLPFTTVRLKTLTSPPVNTSPATQHQVGPSAGENAFVLVDESGAPVPFHLRGADHDGVPVDSTMPLAWVPATATWSGLEGFVPIWQSTTFGSTTAAEAPMDQRKVAFVPADPAHKNSNNRLTTNSIQFGVVQNPATPTATVPGWLPTWTSADVLLEQSGRMATFLVPGGAGNVAQEKARDTIAPDPGYLTHGFEAQVVDGVTYDVDAFADITGIVFDPPVNVVYGIQPMPYFAFTGDQSGGIANPDFHPDTLTRSVVPPGPARSPTWSARSPRSTRRRCSTPRRRSSAASRSTT